MVDLQASDQNNCRKCSDGKVKILMDRTPSFLKSKFLSVLGSSNDLINGLTTKLDISANMSSSSESHSNDRDSNKNSAKQADEVSLDENIIDFESRKVKERRAHDEVSTGKYRHPNFIARSKATNAKKCNIIDTNPESSFSESNSNSMLSKTPTSVHTLAGDVPKADSIDTNQHMDKMSLSIPPGTAAYVPNSELDLQQFSLSEASVELKRWDYSNSDHSIQSLKSIASLESHCEDDTLDFMRRYVDILFDNSAQLTLELKSDFGLKSRTEIGRLLFARLVSAQRARSKRVSENTFYSLVQHFAIVLFECNEMDDFSPAKILMNMCFTFFYEVEVPGCEPYREYLYTYLRYQPIWQAIRFWNAAYFDAVQSERSHRPIPQTITVKIESDSSDEDLSSGAKSVQRHLARDVQTNLDMIKDDQEFQRNICFGQLGTFTCNMHAFGLNKELCDEFLRKQSVISNITKEQEKMLHDNINRMYKETDKWRAN
ncbi:uncharacterized protein KIAA0513 isoform X2 [Sitodiplosis mosellana]|uniref:uncharacterized protein KIAA0513 isoform X2 n=1 Tax=Sitodiplosis mosellana TaxID=263140 RepID=UPI002445139F|nr:uncharacterized protein KIAA0513 isoform X2 [Sitodiplosis mosellana]